MCCLDVMLGFYVDYDDKRHIVAFTVNCMSITTTYNQQFIYSLSVFKICFNNDMKSK